MARNANVKVSRSDDREPEDSRDRISELSDSLLHLILVMVPLVDAVRTCVLSRRWRGLWKRLPLLFFDDVQAPRASRFPDLVEGVLRGYDDDVDIGDLFVTVHRHDSVDDPVGFVATLADLAAHRISGRFSLSLSPAAVNLFPHDEEEEAAAVALQLPCFPRVTELYITFVGVHLVMPTRDTFAKLTKLFICYVRVKDGGEQISQVVSLRCPCIEVLELHMICGMRMLNVVAQSLVSMVLSGIMLLEQLTVTAENLRHMLVEKCFVLSNTRATMFLGVPALERLIWQDRCPEEIKHRELPTSSLQRLVVAELESNFLLAIVGGRSDFARILQLFKRVDTLRLEFPNSLDRIDQDNLIENVKLPYFSELEFRVNETRHRFGPTILNLLRKCRCVKKVTLELLGREEVGYIPCPSNCNCHQVWADKSITLDSLECVAIHGFHATQDDMSLIYYIMRYAKRLRKVSILFSLGANPRKRFYRKLRKLSKASGCGVFCYSH